MVRMNPVFGVDPIWADLALVFEKWLTWLESRLTEFWGLSKLG